MAILQMMTAIFQILGPAIKYIFAKQEEKDQAQKDMIKVFENLDKSTPRATAMRDRYRTARERLRNHY